MCISCLRTCRSKDLTFIQRSFTRIELSPLQPTSSWTQSLQQSQIDCSSQRRRFWFSKFLEFLTTLGSTFQCLLVLCTLQPPFSQFHQSVLLLWQSNPSVWVSLSFSCHSQTAFWSMMSSCQEYWSLLWTKLLPRLPYSSAWIILINLHLYLQLLGPLSLSLQELGSP